MLPTVRTRQDALIGSLRAAGLRITPQRVAICELLASADDHPTAQSVYELLQLRFPSISLATVYNTLEALTCLGAIYELGSAGDNTTHYEANPIPHVNLACIACHRMIDFESGLIASVEREVTAGSGYRLVGARVVYYGLCPACQAAAV